MNHLLDALGIALVAGPSSFVAAYLIFNGARAHIEHGL